ncbi:hypothetical protein ACEYW6_19030 [Nostoc sp. UIC 10607]|uniref:hypothetical protein n=1 Tax=Nostoc sp. UIC 10607 TaxID=3045935 RepID=UPI00399FD713
MSRIKLLHQIAYGLIGTLRIAKNIDWQNACTVRVTALAYLYRCSFDPVPVAQIKQIAN